MVFLLGAYTRVPHFLPLQSSLYDHQIRKISSSPFKMCLSTNCRSGLQVLIFEKIACSYDPAVQWAGRNKPQNALKAPFSVLIFLNELSYSDQFHLKYLRKKRCLPQSYPPSHPYARYPNKASSKMGIEGHLIG